MTDRLFARSHAPVIELAEMSAGTSEKKALKGRYITAQGKALG